MKIGALHRRAVKCSAHGRKISFARSHEPSLPSCSDNGGGASGATEDAARPRRLASAVAETQSSRDPRAGDAAQVCLRGVDPIRAVFARREVLIVASARSSPVICLSDDSNCHSRCRAPGAAARRRERFPARESPRARSGHAGAPPPVLIPSTRRSIPPSRALASLHPDPLSCRWRASRHPRRLSRRTLTLRALSSPGPPPSQTPRFAEDDRASPDALAVTPEATLRVWDRGPPRGRRTSPRRRASSARHRAATTTRAGPTADRPPAARRARRRRPLRTRTRRGRSIRANARTDPLRRATRRARPSRRRPRAMRRGGDRPAPTRRPPSPSGRRIPRRRARARATVPAPVPGPVPAASRGTRPGDLDLAAGDGGVLRHGRPRGGARRRAGTRARARASAPILGAERTVPRVAVGRSRTTRTTRTDLRTDLRTERVARRTRARAEGAGRRRRGRRRTRPRLSARRSFAPPPSWRRSARVGGASNGAPDDPDVEGGRAERARRAAEAVKRRRGTRTRGRGARANARANARAASRNAPRAEAAAEAAAEAEGRDEAEERRSRSASAASRTESKPAATGKEGSNGTEETFEPFEPFEPSGDGGGEDAGPPSDGPPVAFPPRRRLAPIASPREKKKPRAPRATRAAVERRAPGRREGVLPARAPRPGRRGIRTARSAGGRRRGCLRRFAPRASRATGRGGVLREGGGGGGGGGGFSRRRRR